jgi:hypothetical protein
MTPLNFFCTQYILESKLKFPAKVTDGRILYEVGRHQWSMDDYGEGLKSYKWNFFKDHKNKLVVHWGKNWCTRDIIPDFWRKVNGGWQIVY